MTMSLYRPTNWIEKEIALLLWRVTPSCQRMTRLISDAMDRPLPWRKRIALQLHRMICIGCKRYHEQLHFSHDTIHGLETHLDEASGACLPTEMKTNLKDCLHDRE
jgi:hypothetical protein